MKVLRDTQFAGLSPSARGKVRDIYDLGDKLLIVATDRLSAFDVILPTPIPDKGRVLTQLSLFWFDLLKDVIPSHVISAVEFPAPFDRFKEVLSGRSMLVRKTKPLPIECVVRGYVSGSGWKDYRATGKICGIPLPAGLRESDHQTTYTHRETQNKFPNWTAPHHQAHRNHAGVRAMMATFKSASGKPL